MIRLLVGTSLITVALCCCDSAAAQGIQPKDAQSPNGYSFAEREVFYENHVAGIALAGSLTIPSTRFRVPAVVLVGNGVCDRDLSVGRHRTFRALAHHLARCGVAVLRSDGRGVGKSQGKPWPANTKQDLASDLRAALRCLRNQAGIDPNRVGIVGHSEGGTLATVVAANSRDVAFLVILGTPGLPGGDVLCDQISHIAPIFGVRESTTSDYVRLMNQAYNILQQSVIPSGVRRNLETVFETYDARTSKRDKESLRRSGYNVPDNSKDFAASILLPWMKDFLIYDPRPALEQVRCPVLSLIGEKDLQVLAIENSSAIRGALLAGRNQDYTVSILEGLNHLLQTARTGSPAEYELIDETIAPLALTTVSAWILKRTR